MKIKNILVLIGFLAGAGSSTFAQEFIFKTTAANTVASKSTIDSPGLGKNPAAVIIATPLDDPATHNPHPIGAWYYADNWNIFNTDHAPMPIGLRFKVEVFLQRDTRHFVHQIPVGYPTNGTQTYVDSPLLDNHPNANVRIFQNHAPDNRPFYLNPSEARVAYDGERWYIENVNGSILHANTAYNIIVTSGTIGPPVAEHTPRPTPTPSHLNGTLGGPVEDRGPKTLPPPVVRAGGDLSGPYPDPTVVGLNGRPLSKVTPEIGQLLRWNGREWEPADGAALQTFFKIGDDPNLNVGDIELSDTRPERNIAFLSHSIVLQRKSRLVISAAVSVNGTYCVLANCNHSAGRFYLAIDNAEARGSSVPFFADYELGARPNVSGYMIDLNPGTHIIQLIVRHAPGTTPIHPHGDYSSVMVVPLP